MTQHAEMETELKRARNRLQMILNSSSEGILEIDVDGICTVINKSGARALGFKVQELIGTDVHEITKLNKDGEPCPRNDNPVLAVCLNGQGRRAYDQIFLGNNGRRIPVEYSVFPVLEDGSISGAIITFFDISDKKLADKRLDYVINYDPLTDLPNRNLFHDLLSRAIDSARDSNSKLAVLYMNVQGVKEVNESLGHNAGDLLLREFGMRIKNELKKTSFLARTGSYSFSLLHVDLESVESAAEIANKIIMLMRKSFFIQGHEIFLRISIGICIYPNDATEVNTLLSNADTAMIDARNQGTNNFNYYTPDMNADIPRILQLDAGLRRALEKQEFELYYQPQADIQTGAVIGFEALIRWNNPDKGLVSPFEFIPLLEATGLIVEVGEWTIDEACRQIKSWSEKFDQELNISVNLSGHQLQKSDIINPVINIIKKYGISPSRLELEVTETIMMQHLNPAINVITHLSAKGIRFSIDDFGTGYSSLSYLKSFPVHKLKIDRTFVKDMHENSEDEAICAAIVALGQRLGLKIIAEGVELEAQLDKLKQMGCDQIQGYLLSKPLAVNDATRFLQKHIADPKTDLIANF